MDNLEMSRRKYFASPLGNTFAEYKGCILSEGFREKEDQIYNMEVREDDVWLISFPKSGTTWSQEMLWMIMNDLDFEEGRRTLLDVRSPCLEVPSVYTYEELEQESPELTEKFQPKLKDSIAFLQSQIQSKSSLVIKTHLPWQLLPKEIQEGTKKPKIVYISRNPKDVCVSYFYHSQQLDGYSGDFETFCELFLEGKSPPKIVYYDTRSRRQTFHVEPRSLHRRGVSRGYNLGETLRVFYFE